MTIQSCIAREENRKMEIDSRAGTDVAVNASAPSVTVTLDAKTYKELDRCSRERGISKTAIVRGLIENHCRTGANDF